MNRQSCTMHSLRGLCPTHPGKLLPTPSQGEAGVGHGEVGNKVTGMCLEGNTTRLGQDLPSLSLGMAYIVAPIN